eukprot:GFUD01114700.1.p1 GENE.GFUD01114700.1~~GFUD01114700.1.p1  ORF type:complete len:293 (-),score=117.01 GFUD01114700.1:159-1037(-)
MSVQAFSSPLQLPQQIPTSSKSPSSPPPSPTPPVTSPAPSSSTPVTVPKTTKKKAPKTLKDPSAPKRPLTSFLLFAGEERPRVMAELGNISVGEVGNEMGRRWARLDKAGKEKYEVAHREAKARYTEETKNYQPSQQFLEKKAEEDRKQKKKIESGEMEDYFSFVQENWRKVGEEHVKVGPKEVQQIIWQMWSKDMEGNTKKKGKKVKKARDPAEPKRPLSAFFIFQGQMRQELVKRGGVAMSNKEMLGMVAERWRNLDQDLRREYEQQAEDLKAQYGDKMKEFNMKKSAED